MRRVAIFTSASCTGWAFAYDADDATNRMVRKHGEQYNGLDKWKARNSDGSVVIFNTVEEAIADHNEDEEDAVDDLQGLLDYYQYSGDGYGRLVNAAWIVHMLVSDSTNLDEWLPSAN